MQATIAVVDDEEHLREAVVEYLEAAGMRTVSAGNSADFRGICDRESVDVVILDIAMPGRTVSAWRAGCAAAGRGRASSSRRPPARRWTGSSDSRSAPTTTW